MVAILEVVALGMEEKERLSLVSSGDENHRREVA